MVTYTLQDYLQTTTKSQVAREIGVTREAINQMLKANREIYIQVYPTGAVKAWEKRSVPFRQAAAGAA